MTIKLLGYSLLKKREEGCIIEKEKKLQMGLNKEEEIDKLERKVNEAELSNAFQKNCFSSSTATECTANSH